MLASQNLMIAPNLLSPTPHRKSMKDSAQHFACIGSPKFFINYPEMHEPQVQNTGFIDQSQILMDPPQQFRLRCLIIKRNRWTELLATLFPFICVAFLLSDSKLLCLSPCLHSPKAPFLYSKNQRLHHANLHTVRFVVTIPLPPFALLLLWPLSFPACSCFQITQNQSQPC